MPRVIDYESDCKSLLALAIKLDEGLQSHTRADQLRRDSGPLAAKVAYHAATILYLYQDTAPDGIPGTKVKFPDHASILVLVRTLAETVWAFHHLFVEPPSDDERAFRYCCWMLSGFVPRLNFPTLTSPAREQLHKDRNFIKRTRQRVRKTKAFQKLTPKQQRLVLEGRRWRSEKLVKRAEDFLGETFGPSLYAYLSSYGHADALSAIQIRDAPNYHQQKKLAEGALPLTSICLSQTIKAYLQLWPHLELISNLYPTTQELVEIYSRFKEFVADGSGLDQLDQASIQ